MYWAYSQATIFLYINQTWLRINITLTAFTFPRSFPLKYFRMGPRKRKRLTSQYFTKYLINIQNYRRVLIKSTFKILVWTTIINFYLTFKLRSSYYKPLKVVCSIVLKKSMPFKKRCILQRVNK